MTSLIAAVPDSDADIRWREWQVRGAEADRRRATTMGRLAVLLTVALIVWLFVQLV